MVLTVNNHNPQHYNRVLSLEKTKGKRKTTHLVENAALKLSELSGNCLKVILFEKIAIQCNEKDIKITCQINIRFD